MIPGKGDWQDEQERDGFTSEELERLHANTPPHETESKTAVSVESPRPSATRTSACCNVAVVDCGPEHFVERPAIGQLATFDELNA